MENYVVHVLIMGGLLLVIAALAAMARTRG
jgi:hypothetical protein